MKNKRKENSSFHGKKDVPIPGIHPGAAGSRNTERMQKMNMIDLNQMCSLKTGDVFYHFIPHSFSIDTQSYGVNGRISIEGRIAAIDEVVAKSSSPKSLIIERVIFNDPATIVIWKDKTKTVVKCQSGDAYDKEKGLALCIAKKLLGNKSNFNNIFKKYMNA